MFAINHASWRSGRVLLASSIGVLLSACAVGPDYHMPAAPAADDYSVVATPTATATAHGPGGNAQRFVRDMDIPGQWWNLFHSQPLSDLVDDALKHNPDTAAAQQALLQAVENVRAQRGAYVPQVSASIGPTRQTPGRCCRAALHPTAPSTR